MSENDSNMATMLGVFVRRSSFILGIYAVGYWGLSPAWVLSAVVLSVVREKWSRQKKLRRNMARAIALNSEQFTLAKLQDLPSWVHFPDVERAEWLNKMLKQLWPYIGDYVKDLLKTQWEEGLAKTMSAYKLFNFKFEKIYLGDIPIRVGGVKVYSENVQRSEIIMDLEIFYTGDCRIECSFSRMSAGIKDFSMHGVMRIVYKPLIKTIPLIGGMQVYFLSNPDIDFNMLGLADVLDMPGLSGILRNVIVDTIAGMMVLPNKWPIVLSDQVPTKMVTATQPKGLLRLRVIEARDLMRKDRNIFGKGKSDPYAIVYIGAKEYKTKIVKDTIDPVWNYVCETSMLDYTGSSLDIQLWDWDQSSLDKDERLGRCSLNVADIAASGSQDLWVPLEEARSGRIHLQLDWLNLSADVSDIKKQLNEIEDLSGFEHGGLHSAVLTVFVDSAEQIPMASRAANEPCPLVELALASTKQQTTCKYRTLDPVWEEGFSFLVNNPLTQTLTLQVLDEPSQKRLGSLQVELNSLLAEPRLQVEEHKYHLKDSGPHSKLVLTMHLRIFTHDKGTTEDDDASRPSALGHRTVVPDVQHKSDTAAPTAAQSSPASSPPAATPVDTPAVKPAVQVKPADIPTVKPSVSVETKSQPPPVQVAAPAGSVADGAARASPNTAASGLRQRKPDNPAGTFGLGRIQLTLRYSDIRSALLVVVHKISALPMQGDDIPDPYVKLYLLPDRSEDNKRKTKMMKDNCDPVYDETLEYAGSLAETRVRQLQVQVVSKKKFARNPVLGMVCISLSEMDLSTGSTQWYDLQSE